MSKQLPETIDPLRLARHGQSLSGVLPVAHLRRIAPMLADVDDQIDFELQFSQDGQGVPCVEGRVRGELSMICQRCLQTVSIEVNASVNLGIAASEEQAERLPEDYEPLLVGDEPLVLKELLEDEVILALPVAPMHPEGACASTLVADGVSMEQDEPVAEARANPFSVLEKLKH